MSLSEVLPGPAADGGRGHSTSGPTRSTAATAARSGSTTSGCSTGPAPRQAEVPTEELKHLFQDAFAAAVWTGRAESDGFNALVMLGRADAGARRRCCARTRSTCARPARRSARSTSSSRSGREHRAGAPAACELFEARFDPRSTATARRPPRADRPAGADRASTRCAASTRTASSARCSRWCNATLRTNYFQPARGRQPPSRTCRSSSTRRRSPTCPRRGRGSRSGCTRPRVEGVHLRFGPVARGGLRWSDRREDFRTEVLGLVKAQAVKNAVIVPVGAKGGFLPKRLPDPAVEAERPGWPREWRRYRTFISALLDITDNLVDGVVVPPPDVVRHDGDDPYLVVAADKGTATFSDIANGIAQSYGFWLGDAFASGGSVGYDHKAMGITAPRRVGVGQAPLPRARARHPDRGLHRGRDRRHVRRRVRQRHAAVRAHPAGRGVRPPARLPRPRSRTPRRRFAERKRLFELPRSQLGRLRPRADLRGWRGATRARPSRSPISPQVRRVARDRPTTSRRSTPHELMRAILQRPGRPALERRHRHVREGGRGDARRRRRQGQRLDPRRRRASCAAGWSARAATSASPSSAASRRRAHGGPDQHRRHRQLRRGRHVRPRGEHQDPARRAWSASGDLTEKQRNELLAEMTDDVAEHVLRDNYEQNVLLGNARVPGALDAAGAQALHPRSSRQRGDARPCAGVPAVRRARSTDATRRAAGSRRRSSRCSSRTPR